MSHKSERLDREFEYCNGLLNAVGAPAVGKAGTPLPLHARVAWACDMIKAYLIDQQDLDPTVLDEIERIRRESQDMPATKYPLKQRYDFFLRMKQWQQGGKE